MLVLSRKQGESVEFADLDITVRVISLKRSKVQLGIEAPQHIAINRSEIAGKRRASHSVESSGTDESADVGILEQLARIESELAALVELADANKCLIARDLAADSMERFSLIRRSLGLSVRQKSDARPISDFIKVRADVIEQLRVTTSHSDSQDCAEQDREPTIAWQSSQLDRASCARECQPGYAVRPLRTTGECSVA